MSLGSGRGMHGLLNCRTHACGVYLRPQVRRPREPQQPPRGARCQIKQKGTHVDYSFSWLFRRFRMGVVTIDRVGESVHDVREHVEKRRDHHVVPLRDEGDTDGVDSIEVAASLSPSRLGVSRLGMEQQQQQQEQPPRPRHRPPPDLPDSSQNGNNAPSRSGWFGDSYLPCPPSRSSFGTRCSRRPPDLLWGKRPEGGSKTPRTRPCIVKPK